jgi:Cu2+-exporting ATPase
MREIATFGDTLYTRARMRYQRHTQPKLGNLTLEQVHAGDVVVVGAGETIPVDGSITRGIASIDQHMLTGEAQPVEKGSNDQVLASTIVLSGKIHIQVERAGSATTAAQIGNILNQTAAFKEKIETNSIALTERFLPLTIALSLVSLPFVGINRTLALLESSFGYNLRMSGPMSLLNLLQIAAQQGILVKDGAALEQLPTIDTVVFDKTGTLTLEQPHVGAVHTYNSVSEDTVLTWAAAAEYRQTHPIARAILHAAHEQDLTLPPIDDAHYKVGYGLQVHLDGRTIRVGSTRFMEMEQVVLPDAVHQLQAACHSQGYSLVLVAMEQEIVGAIELHPTIRPEAHEVVHYLKQRNLDLYIVSGEHPDDSVAMRGDRIGMSNTHRPTAASYDDFPASEWANPRFVIVSQKDVFKAFS